jgi:hypothetical protein
MDWSTARRDATAVRPEYRPLHEYLRDRYANIVVLTFKEIEDILSASLPEPARCLAEWWTGTDADGTPSPQSHTWTQAKRTAEPNLGAHIVRFERTEE